MLIGYARVSTQDQDSKAQVAALKEAGCEDNIFTEKASGGRWDRPELHKMIGKLRDGDVVVVWKLDRLSRSLKDLLMLMEKIHLKGAGFRSLTEVIDTTSPAGRMMMQIVGSFAEFEREMLRERTQNGLDAARKKGRVGGRRPKLTPEQQREIVDLVTSGRKTAADAARLFKVSPSTVSRLLQREKPKPNPEATPPVPKDVAASACPRDSTGPTFAQLEIDEQKRLLDKLAKLKALSECQTGNVNETATAAAAMTRIMLEYQIQMIDLDCTEDEDDQEVVEETALPDSYNGFPTWKSSMLRALAEVNCCLCYSSNRVEQTVFMKRRTRTRLCLLGTPKDVQNTRQLFSFCVEEVERLCKHWGYGQPVKRRNDFKKGAAHGIAQKVRSEREQVLQEEERRAAAENRSSLALELFKSKEDAVSEYAAKIGIRTVTRRVRAPSQQAYSAGYKAGVEMDLSGSSRPRLGSARSLPAE